MSDRIQQGKLQIEQVLHDLLEQDIAPGTGVIYTLALGLGQGRRVPSRLTQIGAHPQRLGVLARRGEDPVPGRVLQKPVKIRCAARLHWTQCIRIERNRGGALAKP